MPLVSDIVRSALGTDLSPEDIVLLARDPVEVRGRLEAAYAADPPEYTLPPKGTESRPWVIFIYGRENAGSSFSRAPTWRAKAAVQTLIYCHEVAIEDPVAWYLYHEYAEPRDAERTLELLSAVAELAPLIDADIVRCVAQRPSGQITVPESVYKAFARLLYGPQAYGANVEIAAELLELLDFRRRTGGGVDVASHPGNHWVFTALRQAGARLAETTGLLPPSEAAVVVPDITRVTTLDLIRIRQSGAFENWRNQLAAARAVYEESLRFSHQDSGPSCGQAAPLVRAAAGRQRLRARLRGASHRRRESPLGWRVALTCGDA